MKNIKNLIKRNKLIFLLFLNIFRRNAGFHSDQMIMKILKEISRFFQITSFVETGTYRGDSSFIMTRNFPKLSIYTCEITEEFFEIAKERLRNYPKIRVFHQSSEKFLNNLPTEKTGLFPLFFLDAHWYDYWPLKEELKIINLKFNQAIIIIDDFQVPGREDFSYDVENGNLICNFDYIKDCFQKEKKLDLLYPNYSKKESGTKKLCGYIIIFKNLKELFQEFIKNPWIENNFKRF